MADELNPIRYNLEQTLNGKRGQQPQNAGGSHDLPQKRGTAERGLQKPDEGDGPCVSYAGAKRRE